MAASRLLMVIRAQRDAKSSIDCWFLTLKIADVVALVCIHLKLRIIGTESKLLVATPRPAKMKRRCLSISPSLRLDTVEVTWQ